MTSDYEGFGMVLIEAMQFGVVPISFFNWSSLQDIIIHDKTGILVKSDNLNDYINKLLELMGNAKLRMTLSTNAAEHAKKFDIEIVGPKWLKLFENI
jgi:glycosyltransferase involved in cell wall biosynthesis